MSTIYAPRTVAEKRDYTAARRRARYHAEATGATHYVVLAEARDGAAKHVVLHWHDLADTVRRLRVVFVADGGEQV